MFLFSQGPLIKLKICSKCRQVGEGDKEELEDISDLETSFLVNQNTSLGATVAHSILTVITIFAIDFFRYEWDKPQFEKCG